MSRVTKSIPQFYLISKMALFMNVTKCATSLIHRQVRQLATLQRTQPFVRSATCTCKSNLNSFCVESRRRRRFFHSQSGPLRHGDYEYKDPKSPDEIVNITYVDRSGERIPIQGKVGDNVMYLAHRYDIEIEGACEASLACCTCHVILPDEYYNKLPEIEEEEEDMLDLAPFLTATSRLSCQIILTKELEGMEVSLPQATRNFYVDGHVPQPH
ncbi:adrenodoxin-like protein 1, mitochondrial [Patiria miniata]|uniref:2Fe-2S ferredoxin-type domain-containing protein n=1 Tax=Patiria miniata TaxID=46514 RepID=A0A914ATP3_PATMI|nr:adrenodoxin-like protein 1, mitochondrial [Patiria miniata]